MLSTDFAPAPQQQQQQRLAVLTAAPAQQQARPPSSGTIPRGRAAPTRYCLHH